MPHILALGKLHRGHLDQAGHKSVQLSELLSCGFQVPKGFCILSSGYEEFVRANNLHKGIRSLFREICSSEGAPCKKQETELADLFRSANYPSTLKKEIITAYRTLSPHHHGHPARVAVRSSGSLEDGANASFAGQFASCLNVLGESALLDQIKNCWSSFWKVHSLRYQLDRYGVDSSYGRSVLVQEMIPASTAGVLFSANPITGSIRQTVIEASWGLGEAIVEGIVKPDRFVVDTDSMEVIEEEIRNKAIMAVPDRKQGVSTQRVSVSRNKQAIPCLTSEEIRSLVTMGQMASKHFGKPQDIEWAFDDNRALHLLQSRSITTLPAAEDELPPNAEQPTRWLSEFDTDTAPDIEWISATIQDMLPGPLSPLTISQMNILEYGFQQPQKELGLLPRLDQEQADSFLGFFYNRAHLNMSLIRSLTRHVPLVSSANLERILQEGAGPGKSKPWVALRFAKDIPNMFRVGLHALEIVGRLEPAAEKLLASGLKRYEEEKQRGMGLWKPDELLEEMDQIQKIRAEIYAMHITASEFGEVTFQLLRRLTSRWAKDEYGVLASQLITGSSIPMFAKPIAELWGLAQRVSGSRTLRECFAIPSLHSGWQYLKDKRGRAATEFRTAFDSFLKQYGYRSRYGAELMHPRWDEEPAFVLSMVRIYSNLLLTLNPWEMEREQVQRRQRTLRRLESNLNPLSKRVLQELLQLMHTLIPLRQNLRALSLMQAHLARRMAQNLSSHLLRRHLLSDKQDIYFLTMEELHQMISATYDVPSSFPLPLPEILERIRKRKAEYRKNLNVVLPERFRGSPLPTMKTLTPNHGNGEKRLRGLPASPGRVTGQARRITAPLQEVQIQPGEILVLPGMDPGWTPLFLAASAIISERGGILSHGSILAREYGIPAVISVVGASQAIQTGQVITVDGDRGEIWL